MKRLGLGMGSTNTSGRGKAWVYRIGVIGDWYHETWSMRVIYLMFWRCFQWCCVVKMVHFARFEISIPHCCLALHSYQFYMNMWLASLDSLLSVK